MFLFKHVKTKNSLECNELKLQIIKRRCITCYEKVCKLETVSIICKVPVIFTTIIVLCWMKSVFWYKFCMNFNKFDIKKLTLSYIICLPTQESYINNTNLHCIPKNGLGCLVEFSVSYVTDIQKKFGAWEYYFSCLMRR